MANSQNYYSRSELIKHSYLHVTGTTEACKQKARQQLGEKIVCFIFELASNHVYEVFSQKENPLPKWYGEHRQPACAVLPFGNKIFVIFKQLTLGIVSSSRSLLCSGPMRAILFP